jgi:hypothetical protein
MRFSNINYLHAKFVPMHKNIVLCDELPEDYLRNLDHFLQEWESQAESIQVNTSGSTGNPKTLNLSKKKDDSLG